MSLDGFNTALTPHATRADRVAILASDTDALSGIVDDTTDCDSSYWQGLGPTSVTGQAYAAIVDILDSLHGRTADQSLSIEGKLNIDANGVAINKAPTPGIDLDVNGNAVIGGTFSVLGTLNVAGATTFNTDLTLGAADTLVLTDGLIDVKENVVTGEIGNRRNVFRLNDQGTLEFNIPDDDRWGYPTEIPNPASGFGLMCSFGAAREPRMMFNGFGTSSVLSVYGSGTAINEMLPPNAKTGVHVCGNTLNSYAQEIGFWSAATGAHSQTLWFRGGWTPNSLTFDSSVSARIEHSFHASGSSNQLIFYMANDQAFTLEDGKATFSGQSPDFDMDFTVRSYYGDADQYYCRLIPNIDSPSSRVSGSGVVPALQLGSGLGDTKTMRLGFDAFHADNGVRLWMDNQSYAGTIGYVALGKPLGTRAAPLDNLVVMDSPWLVAVNDDPLDLNANHSTKEGLWIGAGDASSTHKAARIWMRDATGYRSTITWGTTEEEYHMFVKDGVQMMTAGSNANNDVGGTVKGAHKLPFIVVHESHATGMANIVLDFDTITERKSGAAVMSYSSVTTDCRLSIYCENDGKWHTFNPDTSTTP